jgi:4-diphosphocytidyl-2-C-methyl-D-erythritol kinase
MMPPQSSHIVFAYACAKINLTLDVLGKRADGYHTLASILQTIALHDTLAITTSTDGHLQCFTDLPELNSEENLVVQAAERLRREAGRPELGARIDLQKQTPVQAGLGGGSSDAASTLRRLNELWEVRVSLERLQELAAELGSDVPFFLYGATALVEGRGELVTPLPAAEPLWLLVAKPEIGIPTRAVFATLSPDEYTDGSNTFALAGAIRAGELLPFALLANSLEPGVMRTYPELDRLRIQLLDAGAPLVRMSGSGPSLFVPFRRLQEASDVFQRARASGLRVWLTHTV